MGLSCFLKVEGSLLDREDGEPDTEELLQAYESQKNVIMQLQVGRYWQLYSDKGKSVHN